MTPPPRLPGAGREPVQFGRFAVLRRGTAYAPGSAELQQAQRLRRSGKLTRQEMTVYFHCFTCPIRGKKIPLKINFQLTSACFTFHKLQTIVFISAARTTQAAAGSVEVLNIFLTAACNPHK